MCGRYASTQTDSDLRAVFDIAETVGDELPPAYNVAPTQTVRTVLERAPKDEPEADAVRQLRSVRWGLIPSWAKDAKIGSRLINARSETITEKPSFKKAAARRRCIVPADGYYEWEKRDGQKVPYFLHAEADGRSAGSTPARVLAMAGLYELWRDPAKPEDDPDRWLWSVTVLTSPAADALGHIHDRSPVIVPENMRSDWLNPAITDLDSVQEMLAAIPEPRLVPYEVSTAVNSVRNNSPELLTPVG
ncbi:SOS response-associated peptidase [Rhodococcus sp. BP-252]|uniref:SOS response-associated peptidase n=1 Tax=unclassified Rhodococcus (in: high G+C Gram-positive bacteria) TaxID=192944 RepID=UPI001C9A7A9B|nr:MULTISPECIES: SOS response-associated peptidase [unclassified Rhodococcus (in: high G+C Gram-positive bacteria)]MBY6412216.1 SOS response-associated peptidase [Rhodococcus sp. BP-320]MBY6416796.1 SOS response-associated peptidase [Rhodococcus sp. BP-321]MBY6421666.1 SOS response-associated peptidase [Rhodococcus sp. BP-324]MBY6426932.1 SOS response-associated peptidase [Rhodococcus sp. BP-323]MBY6432098.1 SOS response-associated peptidase [Rhodococcus sp. BP-322]